MFRAAYMLAWVVVGSLLGAFPDRGSGAERDAGRPAPRTWTSQTGSTTQATFLDFSDGKVRLEKTDGTIVSIPIERLNDADQEYVRKRASAEGEFERKCQELADEITKSCKAKDDGSKPSIAVVDFSDLEGNVSNDGRRLSEELITKLFLTRSYKKVVERLQLKAVIAEHKLRVQGVVDPGSAKELGKILQGVDSVVSGTIDDRGDSLRVNARIISTETGEIIAVAAVTIAKDALPPSRATGKKRDEDEDGNEPAKNGRPEGGKVQLIFQEDFSRYEDGDLPDWGDHVRVQVGHDGRKWLMPSKDGVHHVGKKVSFPDDSWSFELNFTARVRKEANWAHKGFVTSSISLADAAGKQYRIGWQINVRRHVFVLPDGTTQEFGFGLTLPDPGERRQDAVYWLKGRTLRITKNGDVLRLSIDGKQVLSGDVKGFGRFARFEVDVYADGYNGYDEYLCFTNFKVGKIQ